MAKSAPAGNDLDADLLVSFKAGETIFLQGQAGDKMYIIETGEVELARRFGPSERQISALAVGDFFGEMSVLEDLPRTATARALSDCRLLPIDPATFDHLLRQHPEITVRMLRTLSGRLREIDEETQQAQELAAGILAGASIDPARPIEPAAVLLPQPPPPQPQAQKLPQPGSPPSAPTNRPGFETARLDPPERPASLGTAATARLVHIDSGKQFLIAPGRKRLIGRYDPLTGESPEIDLEPLGVRRTVSRRHARIWLEGGKFYVREEVGVTNGTFLKGKRLEAGESREIKGGDLLKLGGVEFLLLVGTGN